MSNEHFADSCPKFNPQIDKILSCKCSAHTKFLQTVEQGRQKRRLNSSNFKTNITHCLICLFMEPTASWVKGYTSTHLIMCMENRLTKAGAEIFHMANAKEICSADDGSVARELHQHFNMEHFIDVHENRPKSMITKVIISWAGTENGGFIMHLGVTLWIFRLSAGKRPLEYIMWPWMVLPNDMHTVNRHHRRGQLSSGSQDLISSISRSDQLFVNFICDSR